MECETRERWMEHRRKGKTDEVPKELLPQYSRLCPELSHDFQELDLSSEPDESSTASSSSSSSDEEAARLNSFPFRCSRRDRRRSTARSDSETEAKGHTAAVGQLEARDFHSHSSILSTSPRFRTMVREARLKAPPGLRGDEQDDEEVDAEESQHRTMIDRLLERHGACIPHHDPRLYRAAAAKTTSIPGFSILAFPDFWGHLPPLGQEPMAPRKPNIQRYSTKVFEDVRRFVNADDIINQVVFDLEDSSLQCPSDSLRFFSKFECGNLRKAVQVRRYEYDLILNADANCNQHAQWFYFEVSNMVADVPYRFNVINCEKSNSHLSGDMLMFYCAVLCYVTLVGMQPVLYSVREALEGRPHWLRTGTEICYFRNHFCPARGRKRTTFYTLTFTITFKHNEDKSVDPAKVFFQQQNLCGTLAGNWCPVVTITACPASRGWRDMHQLRRQIPSSPKVLLLICSTSQRLPVAFRCSREEISLHYTVMRGLPPPVPPVVAGSSSDCSNVISGLCHTGNRPCIVLTGRVHPGESNASWMMKGTLEFLCSSDPVAQSLREAFVFKLIPMLNPDGVINGTGTCDLKGG
ncbi:hypothetical protein FQN60_014650 [Etheostoma spectabile]|uniref:Peptidase M14 domain-containing protein n=1 Tax=Etheostoma spectabile TaxID=54343 RepID=A0A5J5DCS0_9PERO|nr:hypothetical protein FQN60_014650 [Etheostoma spectabile]